MNKRPTKDVFLVGSGKSVLLRKKDFDEAIANEPAVGKRLLEPLRTFSAENKLPLNILEDKEISNDAEVHTNEGDLWNCLEGEVTFIYGGEMVDPWTSKNPDGSLNEREIKAKEIRNGTKTILKAGDWLWIPAGVPHQHICNDLARLVIIKIPLCGS